MDVSIVDDEDAIERLARLGKLPPHISITLLTGTGVLLGAINFRHLLAEDRLFPLLFGGLIPVVISLGIVGIGVYVWWMDWQPSSLRLLTGWFLSGVVLMTLFGGLVMVYELREGASLTHMKYLTVLYPTYGSIPALLTGRYDVQRRVQEQSLRRNREFMTQIEALAEIGGWELDPATGDIEYTDGALQLRELPDSTTTFEEVIASYHEEDRDTIERAVEHCAEDGIPFDVEGRITTEDGHHRWVRVRGKRVEAGGQTRLRGALQEITAMKQREQRIMVLNRVLRHNFRNDLTVIEGHAALIDEKLSQLPGASDSAEIEPEMEAAIAELRTVSTGLNQDLDRLQTLFDEIEGLDVEPLRTNAKRIQETSTEMLSLAEKTRRFEETIGTDMVSGAVDIQPIVYDIVDTYRERYSDTEFDLTLQDATGIGTPEAIHIIVEELVENAIVHNPNDTPVVSVTVSNDGDGHVILSIEDNGPGIPEMEQTVLARGEESSLLHSSGIGLWSVNWLTTRLGAVPSIEKTPEGTRVEVRLPAAESGASKPE